MSLCLCFCVSVRMCICVYIYTFIQSYVYIYIYIIICICVVYAYIQETQMRPVVTTSPINQKTLLEDNENALNAINGTLCLLTLYFLTAISGSLIFVLPFYISCFFLYFPSPSIFSYCRLLHISPSYFLFLSLCSPTLTHVTLCIAHDSFFFFVAPTREIGLFPFLHRNQLLYYKS